MSFVWQEGENSVFVHYECKCTCWRYSKKTTTTTTIKHKHTVKLTMNMVTEIKVSGFLLQRSSTRFPNFGKKKPKILKTYTKKRKTKDGA